MDATIQKILTLVERGTVEQRCAALLVLAALRLQNSAILKTVAATLNHANPLLRDFALRYFEEVEPKTAISLLPKFLEDPDKDVQERAARLLTKAGQAAVPALLQRAPSASRIWQLNAARVLCAVRGKAALTGLLRLLVAGTDEFNKAVCDLMTPAIREMNPKEQEQLYGEIEKFAAKLDPKEQRPAVVSAIRMFGQLGRSKARRRLFRFLDREHHPALRSHALVALLHCLAKEDLHKDEYARLFSLLEETELSEVTRLALDLLDAHPLPDDSRSLLSRLVESPHEAVKQFALRRMGEFGSAATVRTLVQQLADPDYRRRDIAALSLHKIPEARAALIKELIECDNPSKAWTIAEILPTYEGKWRQETLTALWRRLQAAVEAEDRIQASFLHVLKHASAEYVYEQLADQGARLVKAKKYKEALGFLTPLKEFSGFKPEDKFRLAFAQLKLHSHAVAPASHRHGPAVDLLSDLYRDSAYPVFESLRKEKSLAPEDFFYLGFSLVERPGEERNLGKSLLEHVAAKVPRTKIGKGAKNKLKLLKW